MSNRVLSVQRVSYNANKYTLHTVVVQCTSEIFPIINHLTSIPNTIIYHDNITIKVTANLSLHNILLKNVSIIYEMLLKISSCFEVIFTVIVS